MIVSFTHIVFYTYLLCKTPRTFHENCSEAIGSPNCIITLLILKTVLDSVS